MEKEGEGQISFFDMQTAGDNEKDKNADRAVDALREKFGADIIKRGGMIDSGVTLRKKK